MGPLLVRGDPAGDEAHLIEGEGGFRRLREMEVPEVDWIKSAAEKGDSAGLSHGEYCAARVENGKHRSGCTGGGLDEQAVLKKGLDGVEQGRSFLLELAAEMVLDAAEREFEIG